MKLLFTVLFLLAFPVLVLAFRQQFLDHLQDDLHARLRSVLSAPGLSEVRADLNYLDVTLRGSVPEPAYRERLQSVVDGMSGLRCRQEDNLLSVRPKLTAVLEGNRLLLSGWLGRASAPQAIAAWLHAARPELEVDISGVQIDPHVTEFPAPPEDEETPPARELAPLWAAIEVPASLRVWRDGDTFRVSGHLPSIKLRQSIVLAVPLGEGVTPLDFSGLHAGRYVITAPFANEEALSTLLTVFLTTPGAQRIEASGQELSIRGYATPGMRDRWMRALKLFPDQMTSIAGFEVFPSLYHFPSYRPQSPLSAERLEALRKTLVKSTLFFERGADFATPAQAPVLDEAAAAMREAGPEARIVVGVAPPPGVPEGAARRRAEAVQKELVARGVPAGNLETAIFEPVSAGEDGSDGFQVEMLVK